MALPADFLRVRRPRLPNRLHPPLDQRHLAPVEAFQDTLSPLGEQGLFDFRVRPVQTNRWGGGGMPNFAPPASDDFTVRPSQGNPWGGSGGDFFTPPQMTGQDFQVADFLGGGLGGGMGGGGPYPGQDFPTHPQFGPMDQMPPMMGGFGGGMPNMMGYGMLSQHHYTGGRGMPAIQVPAPLAQYYPGGGIGGFLGGGMGMGMPMGMGMGMPMGGGFGGGMPEGMVPGRGRDYFVGPPSQRRVPTPDGGVAGEGPDGYNDPAFYDRVQTPWGERIVERSLPGRGERMQGRWQADNRPPGGWWQEAIDRGHMPNVHRPDRRKPWWQRALSGVLAGVGSNLGQGRWSWANLGRGGIAGFLGRAFGW